MLTKNVYGLTNPQMSIYMSEQLINKPINNIVGTMYFSKDIDIDLLKSAVNLTVKNNQALRTIIFLDVDTPMQYYKDYSYFDIEVYDFSSKQIEDFKLFQKKFTQSKFDIIEHALFKFAICILPNDETALIGRFHHLIADAWSLGLIIDNIAINYSVLSNNLENPQSSGLYSDFIYRENEYISSDAYKKNKDFWNNILKDCNPVSIKNNYSHSYKANRISYTLSKEETSLVNDFCKQYHISVYVFFLAVLYIYLGKFTSCDKFSIQTPILNRLGKEKNTIGMFINMLSINLNYNFDLSILDLLNRISKDSISFFKNSKYPYIHLQKDLRDTDNYDNYNIVYSFQNMRPKTDFPNLVHYHAEWNFTGYIQDELVFNITDINNCGLYEISYDYLIDLFDDIEIEFLHKRIMTIISNIIRNANLKISKINILPDDEKDLLLSDFNNTDFPYDTNTTLVDLFERTVENYPDNIALIYRDCSFTYKELNNMANIIASQIDSYDVHNSKVAILCKKSAWMVAGLIGIMKSGNCYIPIDPTYPEERIKYIIQDSDCKLLVTSEKYKNTYKFEQEIVMDDIDYTLYVNYKNNASPDSLAYMIYTSGTTGTPKGVKIKHKNIINTLLWRKDFYGFNPTHTVLQIPSFSFDSSVEDIFTPLISGSKLVIPSVSRMDINIICEELVKNKVNHFLVVPSLYKILLHEKLDTLSTLQFVTIAGESFPFTLCQEHFKKLPHVRLINEYGPTENSVCSTYYGLDKNDKKVYIGKPIYNCKCYVLDKYLNLLPIGAKGELYVSGPGVSDGYLNKDDLTKGRFLENPYHPNYKMYKTGDIVVQNFSGHLEFIGRDDGQVKLNGFRIELKEIEKNILKNKYVSDVVVLIKQNSSKKQILVAYITSYKCDLDLSDIYEVLRKNLPFYMIPTIVKLDKFPLTPNGKIDKKALPLPITKHEKMTLPKNELENDILNICREVLVNKSLGIHDDLFTVGNADSLSVLTINSRLFAIGIKVRTQDFYKFSTVERLAHYISIKDDKLYANHKYMVKPKRTEFDDSISCTDLKFPYNNVLLTGATGFLGIHILDYLLKNTSSLVYCIIREKYKQPPEKRLENLLSFYFDNEYYKKYKNRIIVINGDLSKEYFSLSQEDYSDLQKNIDCIINSAANTRHYGNYNTFVKENVNTVKNLILFAKPTNIILNHMSTTNISGNYLVENSISYNFTENDFYIGQNYEDNVYVCSKFEAEKLILEEEYKGLKANIFRLGNLMARYNDGTFQKNKFDNAYYTRLITLAKIGYLPNELKKQYLEFSPIDDTAKAIVKLLTIPNLENKIFHIFSDKLIPINMLLNLFKQYGCKCEFTDYNNFISNLHLQKNEKILKYIISDLNSKKKFDYSSDIIISQKLTSKFLNLVGFEWSTIDLSYLERFFDKSDFVNDVKNI